MKIQFIALSFLSLLALPCNADFAKFLPGSSKLENVLLANSAEISIDSNHHLLTSFGHGVRSKKVVLFKANVYVAEFFASDPTKIDPAEDKILASLASQKAKSMRLTFLRNIESQKIVSVFTDALKENSIDVSTSEPKSILEMVSAVGDLKEGSTLVLSSAKLSSGINACMVESNRGFSKKIDCSDEFSKMLFSIWLGKTGDAGLAQLKKEILSRK